jgi:hypothetical protein
MEKVLFVEMENKGLGNWLRIHQVWSIRAKLYRPVSRTLLW